MISYAKLWKLIESKGMKKTDLKEIMSGNTLAKLGKNEAVSINVIDKICDFLDCQPSDIMAHISEKDMEKMAKEIDNSNRMMIENLKKQGISEEQFLNLLMQAMPEITKSMFNGGDTMSNLFDKAIEASKKE